VDMEDYFLFVPFCGTSNLNSLSPSVISNDHLRSSWPCTRSVPECLDSAFSGDLGTLGIGKLRR
jgi:hypothetical protein